MRVLRKLWVLIEYMQLIFTMKIQGVQLLLFFLISKKNYDIDSCFDN